MAYCVSHILYHTVPHPWLQNVHISAFSSLNVWLSLFGNTIMFDLRDFACMFHNNKKCTHCDRGHHENELIHSDWEVLFFGKPMYRTFVEIVQQRIANRKCKRGYFYPQCFILYTVAVYCVVFGVVARLVSRLWYPALSIWLILK